MSKTKPSEDQEKDDDFKKAEVDQNKPEAEKEETIDIDNADVDYALKAVPTYVQDFMKVNGMLDDGHEWMNTRQLKEYLSNTKFSEEQAETLTTYLKDKEARKAEFNAYMKDPTKQSMKEDYLKISQSNAAAKKVDQMSQKIEELQQKNEKLEKDNAERDKRIADLENKTPPVVSMGKAEVEKNNGKKKEKNAIIIKDGDKTYVVTKDMVKKARKELGKNALPSWKNMKAAAKMKLVDQNAIKTLFNENGETTYSKYKSVEEKKPEESKKSQAQMIIQRNSSYEL